jgi:CRP/FNR family cyclic AMP-dependent transcriptional regulator
LTVTVADGAEVPAILRDDATSLAAGSFLVSLSAAEAADLARSAAPRHFSRGDVLFSEGDEGNEVVVIHSGRVKVCGKRAGREVIFSVLDPGSVLGELSVDGSPRSATVIALEPTEVAVISVEDFREYLLTHPRVSSELLRLVAERLRQTSLRQLEFGTTQTLTRLCGTLMELSDRYGQSVGTNVEVTIPLSQQELAELSGMSREALVKGLHQLRSLGWLSVDDRTIVLHDATAIRSRARLG